MVLASYARKLDIVGMTVPESQDEDLSEALMAGLSSAWPQLGGASISRLSGGLVHTTWAVEIEKSPLILQRMSDVFAPGVNLNLERVGLHLRARGELAPTLIRTAEDELTHVHEGGAYRLMTRLPGTSRPTCPDAAAAASSGRLLARFHGALVDFDEQLEPLGFAYRDPVASFDALEAAVARHTKHPLCSDVVDLASRVLLARGRWPERVGLPARIIHGDLKFSNVLFVRDEAKALIDLDTTLCRPLYHDLGDAWRSWCNRRPEDDPRAELDLDLLEASAVAYIEAVDFELEPEERASFTEALERLALELAARFATDALEESWFGWDAERYSRSGLHQLDRARGQLSLHDQARDARPRIRASLDA